MSFLYPRTITILRPAKTTGVGALPYAADVAATETTVLSTIPAAIQAQKEVGRLATKLPGDVGLRGFWTIIFQAPNGTVLPGDIVLDDQGQRYQIVTNYWTTLGYQCMAEQLVA